MTITTPTEKCAFHMLALRAGGFALALTLTAAASAERTLVHEAIINAPVSEVWRMFTTEDGARTWMAPNVSIDLRVGGAMRTSYHPESNLDDEHTIINRILAYEPRRMLAMRNEQAPAGFGGSELFQQTWSVTYFEPLGENRTRLRLVGLGYGEGPEWDQLYSFFEKGNQQVLNLLKAQFPEPENRTSRTLELLHHLVGGEWIHESERPGGSVFRARTITKLGPDGISLTSHGWLGHDDGMIDHGRTIIYRAPASHGGGVRFLNVNENGAVAAGEIILAGDNHLIWDWPMTTLEGNVIHYRANMHFEGNDAYGFVLERRAEDARLPDGQGFWRQQVSVDFTRVEEAPEPFHQMR